MVRRAFETALRAANPRPPQLAWRLGRFDRGMKLFGEIQARIGPLIGRRLLDLGAAHGGDACAGVAYGMSVTLADFRDQGYSALAQQMSPFANMGAAIFNFNEEWPAGLEQYDLITALGVLEHIVDPARFFERLARLLLPGGYAVIQTAMALPSLHRDALFGLPLTSILPMPFRRFIAERVFGRRYSCPLANRTFYSVNFIRRHAIAAGFSVLPCKYADSPILARVTQWPLARAWRRMVLFFCCDYVLLHKTAGD